MESKPMSSAVRMLELFPDYLVLGPFCSRFTAAIVPTERLDRAKSLAQSLFGIK
jgi:hypothetical protein